LSSEVSILDVQLFRRIHAGLTVNVSFRLGAEIGVIFGPSGSGKTSILRLITGLSRPHAGSIRLGDDVLFDASRRIELPLRQRRIGMIFQDDLLFPHLRVRDNIGFGLKHKALAEEKARVSEVAALCGVEDLLDRSPEMLSGGERQRVGLARALAPRPRLLLCDEPVSALDLPNRQTLLERLQAVQRAEHIPVLYVTHSPAEAVSLGTRLYLLEQGKIRAEGAPLDVLGSSGAASFGHLEGLRNALPAHVQDHSRDHGTTRLQLEHGPLLIVPFLGVQPGTAVMVQIRADEILLARGPISGLSAQNLIEGTVERIVPHGSEAEILIRTGDVTWMVSIVALAIDQLSLSASCTVHMIIKARSCHVSRISGTTIDT